MSEKFHLFKKPNTLYKVLAVVSLLFIVFYIVDFFQTKEFQTISFNVVFLQAIIFFLFVSINNRKNSYYIEFFEKELILNFLKYKKKRIEIENIEEIKIKMFNIELTVKNEDNIIIVNLDNSDDDVRSTIKNRFQAIADKLN